MFDFPNKKNIIHLNFFTNFTASNEGSNREKLILKKLVQQILENGARNNPKCFYIKYYLCVFLAKNLGFLKEALIILLKTEREEGSTFIERNMSYVIR